MKLVNFPPPIQTTQSNLAGLKQLFCTLSADMEVRASSFTLSQISGSGLSVVGRSFFDFLAEEGREALSLVAPEILAGKSQILELEFLSQNDGPVAHQLSFIPYTLPGHAIEILVLSLHPPNEVLVANTLSHPFRQVTYGMKGKAFPSDGVFLFLEQFLANAPIGFCFLNRALRFNCVNETLCRFLPYAPDQIIGRSVKDLLGKKADATEKSLQQILRKNGAIRDLSVELGVHGETVHTLQEYYPIFDGEGATIGICGIVVDVTNQKVTEQNLLRTRKDLKRHTKQLKTSNDELTHFAQVASHDLKEPLRAVRYYLDLIQLSAKNAEKLKHYTGAAVEATTRMKSLINDLLAYCKVGATNQSAGPVFTEDAVDIALSNLQAAVEESHAQVIRRDLPTNVLCEKEQLVQLFQNLIENAIKYCNKGETPEIKISCQEQGDQWSFEVRDNGMGIDKKNLEKVFQVFERLHTQEAFPGTGIGLATCKRIVEKYGGEIWVESEPSTGSNFRFTLPKVSTEKKRGQKKQKTCEGYPQ